MHYVTQPKRVPPMATHFLLYTYLQLSCFLDRRLLHLTLSEIKRDFPMEFPFFDSKT